MMFDVLPQRSLGCTYFGLKVDFIEVVAAVFLSFYYVRRCCWHWRRAYVFVVFLVAF